MSALVIHDARSGYRTILDWVLREGDEVSPRGLATREVLGAQIRLIDPTDALPIGTGRKLNTILAAVEALQLIGGVSTPELLIRVAPNTAEFASWRSDGQHRYFHGAYGPRVIMAMVRVLAQLRSDRDSRQAVVNIWEWRHDLLAEQPDVPCTLTLQFMVRRERLLMITTMRSNDVWWGVPYDLFQFTQLQLTLAAVLGIEAGEYVHQAGSLHIYERNLEESDAVVSVGGEPDSDRPEGIGPAHGAWALRTTQARTLLQHPETALDDDDLRWYRTRLLKAHAHA